MQNDSEHSQHMHQAWLGEIFGEALFNSAAAAADSADQAAKWQKLAQLEKLVGQTLARYLPSSDTHDCSEHIDRGTRQGRAMGQQPWTEALASFAPITQPAIDRFRAMLDSCPAAEKAAVELLVAHEVALQNFAEHELAGDPEAAMREIDTVLRMAPD